MASVGISPLTYGQSYQDIDGLAEKSLHVFYEDDGRIAAYLRAVMKEPGVVQIGRVLTVDRRTGLGGKLLNSGIEEVRERFRPTRICIEAQSYPVGFYAREGFRVTSEEFLEDGIPHVKMEKNVCTVRLLKNVQFERENRIVEGRKTAERYIVGVAI